MAFPRQEMMMRDPFGFGGFGAFGGMPDIFAQVIYCFFFLFFFKMCETDSSKNKYL